MSRDDAADVFLKRADPDWAMFCRGRADESAPWVGGEPFDADGRARPVPLAPEDGAHDAYDAGEVAALEPGVRHFYAKVVGVVYPNEGIHILDSPTADLNC